jgi:WD40 repeat protein
MRTLHRPRLWIALLLGIGAALIVGTVNQHACWSVRFPWPKRLIAISSDGRYLVTSEGADVSPRDPLEVVRVWDREQGFKEAWIEFRSKTTPPRLLFSLDETSLAFVVSSLPSQEDIPGVPAAEHFESVHLYDLASGRLLKNLGPPDDPPTSGRVHFSPGGQLLAVSYRSSDFVVRDFETGLELRRWSSLLNGEHPYIEELGEFAIYRQGKEIKVHSRLTGELMATHDLIGNFMTIDGVSRDGQVVSAHGWPPGASPWSASFMAVLVDASTGARHTVKGHPRRVLSPDGQHIAQFGATKRPAWLTKWGLFKESVPSVDIIHWQTDETLATFLHASEVRFSPQGNQIAVVRDDGVVDVYPFPFETPWGLIAGSGLAAAFLAWSIGWLWGRWRGRSATRSTPDTPPH